MNPPANHPVAIARALYVALFGEMPFGTTETTSRPGAGGSTRVHAHAYSSEHAVQLNIGGGLPAALYILRAGRPTLQFPAEDLDTAFRDVVACWTKDPDESVQITKRYRRELKRGYPRR